MEQGTLFDWQKGVGVGGGGVGESLLDSYWAPRMQQEQIALRYLARQDSSPPPPPPESFVKRLVGMVKIISV